MGLYFMVLCYSFTVQVIQRYENTLISLGRSVSHQSYEIISRWHRECYNYFLSSVLGHAWKLCVRGLLWPAITPIRNPELKNWLHPEPLHTAFQTSRLLPSSGLQRFLGVFMLHYEYDFNELIWKTSFINFSASYQMENVCLLCCLVLCRLDNKLDSSERRKPQLGKWLDG